MTQDTLKWMQAVTGGDSVNAVAAKSGLVGSTLTRQVHSGALTPESVVAIANAYDADAIKGLLVQGLISQADIDRHGAAVLLDEITDRMLADEVWERMQEGRGVKEFEDPAPRFDVVRPMAAKRAKEGPLDGQEESFDGP